jgi:hypothetical protein
VAQARLQRRVIVPKFGRIAQWVIGVAVSGAAAAAHAQNLDARKSPSQIFSDTCNACHRSPRELKQTTPGFMRNHYTTDARQAAAMAAYLAGVGSDPRAVQQRPPPALGAGPSPPTEAKPSESPQGAAALASVPRRPSESLEVGKLSEGSPPQTVAAPATLVQDFEE